MHANYSVRGGETHRRDLIRQVDLFGDANLALLNGALELDVLDLLTQIGLGVDKTDIAVFNDEVHVGALLNRVLDGSGGFDRKSSSTVETGQYPRP